MERTNKYYEELNYDELMSITGGDDDDGSIIKDIVDALCKVIETGRGVYSDLRQIMYDAGAAAGYNEIMNR